MAGVLLPTLYVFASFLLVIASLTGIGLGVRRLFVQHAPDWDTCALAFWHGFGMVILFLLLWNFLFPVNGVAMLLVLVAGGAGIVAVAPVLPGMVGTAGSPPPLAWVLAMLAGLWLANLATGPFTSWDGGLYHVQAVQWASQYPVVHGIANLYGPLAFNNSSFLYAALLDSGPWQGRAFHLANGALVFAFLWQLIVAGTRIVRARGVSDSRDVYLIVLLVPLVKLAMDGRLADFNTDLPATLVVLVAGAALYAQLSVPAGDAAERDHRLVGMAILLSTIVCLKTSVGSFSMFALPVAGYAWWRDRLAGPAGPRRPLVWTAGLVLVFAVAWTARGVIMSGYPLFPLSLFGLPVDWKAPAEHAAAEVANIVYTELEFSWHLGRDWLRQLVLAKPSTVLLPSCLAALAGTVLVLAGRKPGHGPALRRDPGAWLLLVPALAAILIWFLVAPSLRYAMPLFWTLAALLISRVCLLFEERLAGHGRRLVAAALLAGLLPLANGLLRAAHQENSGLLDSLLEHAVSRPGPDAGFHPVMQAPAIKPFVTASGLVLNTPDPDTPGMTQVKCWDLPLPCTPNPAANLVLRVPGQLQHGFRVDGAWAMQDWPYYWRGRFLKHWRQRRDRGGAGYSM